MLVLVVQRLEVFENIKTRLIGRRLAVNTWILNVSYYIYLCVIINPDSDQAKEVVVLDTHLPNCVESVDDYGLY